MRPLGPVGSHAQFAWLQFLKYAIPTHRHSVLDRSILADHSRVARHYLEFPNQGGTVTGSAQQS